MKTSSTILGLWFTLFLIAYFWWCLLLVDWGNSIFLWHPWSCLLLSTKSSRYALGRSSSVNIPCALRAWHIQAQATTPSGRSWMMGKRDTDYREKFCSFAILFGVWFPAFLDLGKDAIFLLQKIHVGTCLPFKSWWQSQTMHRDIRI